MKPFAKYPRTIPPSGIRILMEKAMEIPDAIHLAAGQPDFNTPKHIIDAAYQAALEGYTGYTPNAGLPSLREAIAQRVTKVNGIKATKNDIVVTVGAVGAISSILFALLDAGDEALLPDPGWPNYDMMLALCGAKRISYPCYEKNGFVPDLEDVSCRITDKTKVIVVNSPNNPTGAVYPEEVLRGIVQIATESDIYVLSDEAYEELIFDGEHISPAQFAPDGRVVSVYCVSKAYAMTGWRVGYILSTCEELTKLLTLIQEPIVSCAASVSQKAAEAALTGPQDCVHEMVNAYHRRRDAALKVLQDHGLKTYIPHGAFYMLANISKAGMDSFDFALKLLKEKKVAVAPGITFGERGKDYVRICFAADDESLVEGVKRFCEFLLENSKEDNHEQN